MTSSVERENRQELSRAAESLKIAFDRQLVVCQEARDRRSLADESARREGLACVAAMAKLDRIGEAMKALEGALAVDS